MSLFDAYELQGLILPNRIVMAPMTRSRLADEGVFTSLNAFYYAQRATSGLIISEAINVEAGGKGYLFTPGLYTREQLKGAALITDAVHDAGGRIFAQLSHVGRVAHVSTLPNGTVPLGPASDPAENVYVFGRDEEGRPGKVPCSHPRAMSDDEVQKVISHFTDAAANAEEAGFDGVEILAANGYLFEQFLNSVVNTRAGRFGGGSASSRITLITETLKAIKRQTGSLRIGIRLSPFGTFNGMPADPLTTETYLKLADELEALSVCYVHFNDEPVSVGHLNEDKMDNNAGMHSGKTERLIPANFLKAFRERFTGPVIICGGMTAELADTMMEKDEADLFAFGVPFIANPDLPARLKNDWLLAEPNVETFYSGGAKGYVDYPAYKQD